ncbi:hypothetical protein PAMA_019115 [Pampus argenteus]
MASNGVIRTNQPDFRKHSLLCVGFVMISALFKVFEDKTAEEERKREMVLSIQQAFSQCLDAVAGILARGLNVLVQYVTHFLQAAGIQVGLPVYTVTPGGVIFVAQWVLLLLIGYGVIYVAFRLATFFLRWLCGLLKVGVFFACFGLILNDYYVGTETTATRLVCLGLVCESQLPSLLIRASPLNMSACYNVDGVVIFYPNCPWVLGAISYVLQGEAGEALLFELKSTANICVGIFTFPMEKCQWKQRTTWEAVGDELVYPRGDFENIAVYSVTLASETSNQTLPVTKHAAAASHLYNISWRTRLWF